MKNDVIINWEYSGKKDFVNGTGAYLEERILGYVGSLIIPCVLVVLNLNGELQWNIYQIVIGVLLGFDLGGGMISNALNSGKRFYHTEVKQDEGKSGRILKNHLLFAGIHVQPFVVGLVFNNMDWLYGLLWYLIFMTAAIIVHKTPLYLQRPVSMMMVLLAVLINTFLILPIEGFGWFVPVLFLKIIYGHMVREEPYRKNL